MSFSPSITNDSPNEQQVPATIPCCEPTASSSAAAPSEPMLDSSSVASIFVPTLSARSTTLPSATRGQNPTPNDDEDNLMELIDESIHNFLNRANRPSPYRSFFRWTYDDAPNLSYSIIVKIEEPSRLR